MNTFIEAIDCYTSLLVMKRCKQRYQSMQGVRDTAAIGSRMQVSISRFHCDFKGTKSTKPDAYCRFAWLKQCSIGDKDSISCELFLVSS
ncbi:hypothetical protein D3C73_1106660 [compost metagenome]